MSEAEFTTWSLRICLGVLVVFLGFIVWDLGKKSQAGKFGMFILFFVLGLGVMGFMFKNVLVELILMKK